MAEQDKPFVINDRRKFRMDGEPREPQAEKPVEPSESSPNAEVQPAANAAVQEPIAKVIPFGETPAHREHTHSEPPLSANASSEPIPINAAHTITPGPEAETAPLIADADEPEANLPPPPTQEEISQVKKAYEATADRLETVMRATNPGAEHLPPMDFTRMVQSIYMSAMMQLGAGTPQGGQARVDLLGAKQSIEMLNVVVEKSAGNLDETETRLVESALFELQMGFLEITQLLARQAATKQGAPGASPLGASPFGGGPSAPGGPRIVT